MAFVDDFLEHYGTKGMKWGVRKQLQLLKPSERVPYIFNKDEKWASKIEANPKVMKVTRIAARDIKNQSKELKSQYRAQGISVKKGLGKTRYENELKDITFSAYERATKKVHGTSPTGLRQAIVLRNMNEGTLTIAFGMRQNAKIDKQLRKISKSDARRAKLSKISPTVATAAAVADAAFNPISYNRSKARAGFNVAAAAATAAGYLMQSDEVDSLIHEDSLVLEEFEGLELLFILDEEGFVNDVMTPFDDDLEQSDFTDEFLQHYGMKGMKWGVRKASKPRPAFMPPAKSAPGKPKWQSPPTKKTTAPTPTASKATKSSRFAKNKTSKVLSEEAQQFRDLRVKAKKEGVQALTNKDLELINKRIELQSKYNKAFPKKKNPFVEVAIEGILSDYGSKKVVDLVKKKNPAMGLVVEAAMELNKQARKSSNSKNK